MQHPVQGIVGTRHGQCVVAHVVARATTPLCHSGTFGLWYTVNMSTEIETEELVGPTEIVREFGIPRMTLHLFATQGRIPAVDVSREWHQRRRFKFRRSEVRAALDRMRSEREERLAHRAS